MEAEQPCNQETEVWDIRSTMLDLLGWEKLDTGMKGRHYTVGPVKLAVAWIDGLFGSLAGGSRGCREKASDVEGDNGVADAPLATGDTLRM